MSRWGSAQTEPSRVDVDLCVSWSQVSFIRRLYDIMHTQCTGSLTDWELRHNAGSLQDTTHAGLNGANSWSVGPDVVDFIIWVINWVKSCSRLFITPVWLYKGECLTAETESLGSVNRQFLQLYSSLCFSHFPTFHFHVILISQDSAWRVKKYSCQPFYFFFFL